jgi:DNA-binding transcriptional regulator PaaX
MARNPKRSPEEQAAWDERTRLIEANIAKLDRKIAEQKAAREQHRRRLRRLSFGLLGRS